MQRSKETNAVANKGFLSGRKRILILTVVLGFLYLVASLYDTGKKKKIRVCFGSPDFIKKYFYLDDKGIFTNLNHGSFGTVAKPVHQTQQEFFRKAEARPDPWFRETHYEVDLASRQAIAAYIGAASEDDVVLVENASAGVNSVLRSLALLESGDVVLRMSTAYNMVVETLDYLVETRNVEVVVVPLALPVTGSEPIIQALRKTLQRLEKEKRIDQVKLCIFSHISSLPAIVFPLHNMVTVARHFLAPSSRILVDGAHAPGQLPHLDVPSYGVDIYVGNCHKWLYAPKGTAFLWVAPLQSGRSKSPHSYTDNDDQLRQILEPTVISSSGMHDFVGKYMYTGTRDYTHFAAVPSALDFRQNVLGGDDAIYNYCHGLALEVGHMLVEAWNTSWFVPPSMTAFLVNIVLPIPSSTSAIDAVRYMQTTLYERHGIYIMAEPVVSPVCIPRDTGTESTSTEEIGVVTDNFNTTAIRTNCLEMTTKTFYITRLSTQVYLSIDDFKPLKQLVPQLLEEAIEKEIKIRTS